MTFLKSTKADTRLVQVFRWPKKGPLLIQRSRPLSDSQEPKTKQKKSILARAFLENPFFVLFLHKSWIWRTGPGTCYGYFFLLPFHIASKECFWPKKSKFHAWVQKCHLNQCTQLIFVPKVAITYDIGMYCTFLTYVRHVKSKSYFGTRLHILLLLGKGWLQNFYFLVKFIMYFHIRNIADVYMFFSR